MNRSTRARTTPRPTPGTSPGTRSGRRGPADLGASALEWAIIAAVVVVAASVIGGIVFNIVQTKSDQLEQCATQPVGSAACAGPAGGAPAGS